MQSRIIGILLFMILTGAVYGQTHLFRAHIARNKTADGQTNSCVVTITVITRSDPQNIQMIHYNANYLNEDVFKDRNFVRYYVPGKNKRAGDADNDFGDLVVTDLNADGREDFAVKNDAGGNGGPSYNFYLQNDKGIFALDKYLTDSVGSFPKFINKENKTITTLVHANVGEDCKSIYQFNPATGKWTRVNRVWIR